MATSGSTNFSQTSREIITGALTLCQEIGRGQTPSAEDGEYARVVLNQMLKTWGAEGRLWLTEEGSVTLLASTASYALTGVRKVLQVRRRITSGATDMVMTDLSRSDYFALPNKASVGSPLSWYFDPQRATKTLYVWPVPDATIAASTTLPYTYARFIEDVDALDDEPDVPQEWLEALTYGLARRLAPTTAIMGTPAWLEIKEASERLYGALSIVDQEDGSVFFQPA